MKLLFWQFLIVPDNSAGTFQDSSQISFILEKVEVDERKKSDEI